MIKSTQDNNDTGHNREYKHKHFYKTYKTLQALLQEINDTGHKDIKDMEQ